MLTFNPIGPARLRKGDALDLDVDVLGQGLDGDAGPGGLLGEPLLVLDVHVGEQGHVGQEDVHLDDAVERRAGRGEDGLQVRDAGGRLHADGALDQVALGVAGDLPGAVDGRRRLDGVGLYVRLRG